MIRGRQKLDKIRSSSNDGDRTDIEPIQVSEGWLGLRELAQDLFRQKGMTERDITICSHWMVTEGTLIDPSISMPAFNDIVRRKVSKKGSIITNTDLGRLGESFTHRLLSASAECHVGPESSGVCDISDREDGEPTKSIT